jgi:hypothetical protein
MISIGIWLLMRMKAFGALVAGMKPTTIAIIVLALALAFQTWRVSSVGKARDRAIDEHAACEQARTVERKSLTDALAVIDDQNKAITEQSDAAVKARDSAAKAAASARQRNVAPLATAKRIEAAAGAAGACTTPKDVMEFGW